MKRQPIGFRELLEQVLPLDRLPPPERFRVQRALQSGVTRELEAAALMAMEHLEGQGTLRRIADAESDPSRRVRFEQAEASHVITLEYPAPSARDGILLYPRAALPRRASADLTQIRQLLDMEHLGLLSDPRSHQARDILHEHLMQAGLELVGTSDVHLFSLPGDATEGRERPLDANLASRALAQPELLFYCPDLTRSQPLAGLARGGAVRSLALLAVTSGDQTPVGLLEVRSGKPLPFQAEDLARVALLADFCAMMLDRAARLEKLVFVDPMTGVYNRSYFELQARNEIARALREQASVGLCIADIDDFKAMNTAYGYEAGNEVLTQVANTLKRGVRPFDTVARWGGEEFAVLLTPPAHLEDVAAICERLRHAVERLHFSVEGLDRRQYDVRVSVSMGVAVFPGHGDSSAELWRAANQALLEAKRPPKNRVVFYRR